MRRAVGLPESVRTVPTAPTSAMLRMPPVSGPGLAQTDATLSKFFPITERVRVKFQADAFNVLNRTNFNGLNLTTTNSNFGTISSAFPPRQLQLGVEGAVLEEQNIRSNKRGAASRAAPLLLLAAQLFGLAHGAILVGLLEEEEGLLFLAIFGDEALAVEAVLQLRDVADG